MSNKLDELQDRADEGKSIVAGVLGFALYIGSVVIKSLIDDKENSKKADSLISENRKLESAMLGLGHFLNNDKIKENNDLIDQLKK